MKVHVSARNKLLQDAIRPSLHIVHSMLYINVLAINKTLSLPIHLIITSKYTLYSLGLQLGMQTKSIIAKADSRLLCLIVCK